MSVSPCREGIEGAALFFLGDEAVEQAKQQGLTLVHFSAQRKH